MSHSDWVKSLQHKSKDEILKDMALVNREAKKAGDQAKEAGAILSTDSETLLKEGEKIFSECSKAIQAAICGKNIYTDTFTPQNISLVSDAIATAVKAATNTPIPAKVCDMICALIFRTGLDLYCKPYRDSES